MSYYMYVLGSLNFMVEIYNNSSFYYGHYKVRSSNFMLKQYFLGIFFSWFGPSIVQNLLIHLQVKLVSSRKETDSCVHHSENWIKCLHKHIAFAYKSPQLKSGPLHSLGTVLFK